MTTLGGRSTIGLAVLMVIAACASANTTDDPTALKRKADIALASQWKAEGIAQVEAVFAYAEYLVGIGDKKEALKYMQEALKRRPWDLARQLQYARLVEGAGNKQKAKQIYELISSTAENDDLVVNARQRLHKDVDISLEPAGPMDGPARTVVLVPIGKPDPLLLKEVAHELSERLGITVCTRDAHINAPAPSRNKYHQFMEHIRQRMLNDPSDPELTKELKRQNVALNKLADDDALAEFLIEAETNPDEQAEAQAVMGDLREQGQQWLAPHLLKALKNATQEYWRPGLKYIALTPMDIYEGQYQYLFWQTQPDRAVISYARFKGSFMHAPPNRDRLRRRIVLSAMSCIGSMYGVDRCTNPTCPHSFPNSVAEHDAKTNDVCQECQHSFNKVLGRQPIQEN